MAPNPEITRQRLVKAAEQLFAERGVEGVSLREITATAGVRNSTALQYHFGDRAGLLRAVLARHHGDVEADRHARLDAWEAAGADDLRGLVGAFVRPAAAKLADPDGGREYLRILAQLVNRPEIEAHDPGRSDPTDSTYRWRQLVAPFLPEVTVRRLHVRFTAIRLTFVELARRAEMPRRRDDRLFTSHLVDVVTAVLTVPTSDETAALLAASRRPKQAEPAGRAKPAATGAAPTHPTPVGPT